MNKLRNNHETQQRYEFALETVEVLGTRALQLIKDDITMSRKPDSSKVTTADILLNDLFIDQVESQFPGDLVWGEEASNSEKGDLSEAGKNWLWLIDPIDGTSGFWRAYQQQKFSNCTATTLVTGFAPGETTPTVSVAYNPFQDQRMMLSANPKGAFYHTSSALIPEQVKLEGGPTRLTQVRRFEKSAWGDAEPRLTGLQDMVPYGRRLHHQLFMAAVALGDSDLSAFAAPSHPHDVAGNAHIVARAGGAVRSLKGQQFEDIDWRVDPIHGVVAAATPELADEFLDRLVA